MLKTTGHYKNESFCSSPTDLKINKKGENANKPFTFKPDSLLNNRVVDLNSGGFKKRVQLDYLIKSASGGRDQSEQRD